MIRTHNTTVSMVERIMRLVSEVPERVVIVAYDDHAFEDHLGPYSIYNFQDLLKKTPDKFPQGFVERVITYNSDMIHARYPSLKETLPEEDTETDAIIWRRDAFAWECHDEAIQVALEAYKKTKNDYEVDANGIWVLEDDIDFTGNWADLLDNYENGDLVGLFMASLTPNDDLYHHFLPRANQKFKHKFIASDAGSQRLGRSLFYHRENIVYYSKRMLLAIGEQLDNGLHAESEFGTPTMCAQLGEFSCSSIPPSLVISLDWTNSSQEAMEAVRAKGVRGLIHPCKW